MAKMEERLESLVARHEEINELMMRNDIVSDRKEMAKLGREQNELLPVVDTYNAYKKACQELEDAKVLSLEDDKEIREMALMEIEELEPAIQEYLDKLELLLVPKDPNDSHNCILDSEAGGYSLVSFKVNGDGAYGTLKFESGSHRVQRVPKTESQGRIHTSTATVLCMPEIEEEDFDIDMNDLEIETMRSSGAGGQHINKTDSAVRIVHKPTGIVVKCQDGRSQHENRATALMTIRARVYEERQREIDEKAGAERRTKIGTGDRAEKIRTYNYPQNRVTDHRIGYTVNQLDRIMDGRLEDLMNALQLADQQAKLAGENQ